MADEERGCVVQVGPINQAAVQALARAAQVDTAAKAEARKVLVRAHQRAPFRTGRLRRSLTVVKVGGEYRIGWDPSIADYGPYVEFGTNDTPAEPHLLPAAKARR